MEAVRMERGLKGKDVPSICLLDFDGDLTDWLVASGIARPFPTWACFHTKMYSFWVDGLEVGIVARTIGGPYAVLVAEQLLVCGAEIQLGLTSAGRIDPTLSLPSLVVATSAIRDEGTSYHYVAPAETIAANAALADCLYAGLQGLKNPVHRGRVWTTDAPYRETLQEIDENASRGALAVEMQAASLFAFAEARTARIGIVAHLTNAVDHTNEQFDKGSNENGWEIVLAMCRSVRQLLSEPTAGRVFR
ncbi:uridine phosphorylase [Granulicella aggregans]|uniref:Uridine phosphorylase n=1 Tax=Granulicella aggregans TaxID=474949 RepID=A0A7W7ZJF9_9BACT|nr:uridine phosphorylase [Granulicella aggregans]